MNGSAIIIIVIGDASTQSIDANLARDSRMLRVASTSARRVTNIMNIVTKQFQSVPHDKEVVLMWINIENTYSYLSNEKKNAPSLSRGAATLVYSTPNSL